MLSLRQMTDHVYKVISEVLGPVFKVTGRVIAVISNISEDWPCGKADLSNMTHCVIELISQIS